MQALAQHHPPQGALWLRKSSLASGISGCSVRSLVLCRAGDEGENPGFKVADSRDQVCFDDVSCGYGNIAPAPEKASVSRNFTISMDLSCKCG